MTQSYRNPHVLPSPQSASCSLCHIGSLSCLHRWHKISTSLWNGSGWLCVEWQSSTCAPNPWSPSAPFSQPWRERASHLLCQSSSWCQCAYPGEDIVHLPHVLFTDGKVHVCSHVSVTESQVHVCNLLKTTWVIESEIIKSMKFLISPEQLLEKVHSFLTSGGRRLSVNYLT